MKSRQFLGGAYQNRTTAQTRAYYDRWSKVYDTELTQNAYRQPMRCAQALAANLADPGAPVLDAGCGTGLSGLAFAQTGLTLLDGCDLSPKMLKKADSLGIYRRCFISDLNLPPLDAEAGSYGAVAAVGVFSFGHVQANALDEFLRLLKRGGLIVIGVNDHYYQEGALSGKLSRLEAAGRIKMISAEHGEHIPGTGLTGWVIVAEKSA